MVVPSSPRWLRARRAIPWFAALAVTAAGLSCAIPAPSPARHAPEGVHVGLPQRGIALQPKGRSVRSEGVSSDLLKIGPAAPAPLESFLAPSDRPMPGNGLCPADMASVDDRYCIDRYEGALVEILPSGDERPFGRDLAVEGHVYRAVSGAGQLPQGYISAVQAETACKRSGKRLCSSTEWRKACRGPERTKYGYGDENVAGRCNDHGKSPMLAHFGLGGSRAEAQKWTIQKMNDPALNQVPGTLAPSGSHPGCTNGYGVYDMVGNLHEWTNDPQGTFLGGYYLDTHQNGDGCDYGTYAHAVWYHDYSTGFRCCADVAQ